MYHVNKLGLLQVEDEEDLKQGIRVVRFVLYLYYAGNWAQGEFQHGRNKAGGYIGGWYGRVGKSPELGW